MEFRFVVENFVMIKKLKTAIIQNNMGIIYIKVIT